MLGHQGDVPAQVVQSIVLDLQAIEEELALFMLVEARNEIGKGRLATARAAHQGHHLPRLGGEVDPFQYGLVGARVTEGQVAYFQATLDALALFAAIVTLGGLVELFEDAFRTGHAALDGGADLGELADRLGQEAGHGDIGHQVTGGGIAAQPEHQEHQHRHGRVDHQLQHGRINRAGLGHGQLLVGVGHAGIEEALLLVGLAAKAAHHPIALDGLGGDVGDVTHG